MMKRTYERTAEQLLKGQPKARPFGRLIGNTFVTGTLSLHRTPQSRRWQLFWRLKQRRSKMML
jgi:hypothetical protein